MLMEMLFMPAPRDRNSSASQSRWRRKGSAHHATRSRRRVMRRKTIEVGIDIGPADDRASDDVGSDAGVGGAVAAIAERNEAMWHARDRADDRQAGGRLAERAGPGIVDRGIEVGETGDAACVATSQSCG